MRNGNLSSMKSNRMLNDLLSSLSGTLYLNGSQTAQMGVKISLRVQRIVCDEKPFCSSPHQFLNE